MEGKKFRTLSGVLLYPLCIGDCAIILHDRGVTRTSGVVVIHSAQGSDIRFETKNTYYRLLLAPVSQVVDCRPAMVMAA